MQNTSCPHKQAGTNQCQSPFPRPINVIPSPTKLGLIERHCSSGHACEISLVRMNEILTFPTVRQNFKDHQRSTGRNKSGRDDSAKQEKVDNNPVWECLFEASSGSCRSIKDKACMQKWFWILTFGLVDYTCYGTSPFVCIFACVCVFTPAESCSPTLPDSTSCRS